MSNTGAFNKDYNIIDNAISEFSKEEQLQVFRKMSEVRAFEQCIVEAGKSGRFSIKVHMSTGEESIASALAVAVPEYQYFIQHRSMDIFITLGGNPAEVRDEMMCMDSGCCGGKIGGAFQLHKNGRDIYTHTGLIGENISVGVGMALGNGRNTLCLFGDGAAEEDYALTAYGFAVTHRLPVLFICVDNGLSVLSPLEKRRTWDLSSVAKGFGMPTVDITDDPFTLMHWIKEFEGKLPALINVRTCRDYWHAGLGVDGPPDWDRYSIVSEQLQNLGYTKELETIKSEAQRKMEEVWKEYL